jgi:hypothetical protein
MSAQTRGISIIEWMMGCSGGLAFGAWSVYSSSVSDPTEVSSVTYDMVCYGDVESRGWRDEMNKTVRKGLSAHEVFRDKAIETG